MANRGYTDKDRSKSRVKQLKALQLMILLLPRENAILLECLLDLLHSAASVTENKMSASSLGVVFGPSLLCPRKVNYLHSSATLMESVYAMILEQQNCKSADASIQFDQLPYLSPLISSYNCCFLDGKMTKHVIFKFSV